MQDAVPLIAVLVFKTCFAENQEIQAILRVILSARYAFREESLYIA